MRQGKFEIEEKNSWGQWCNYSDVTPTGRWKETSSGEIQIELYYEKEVSVWWSMGLLKSVEEVRYWKKESELRFVEIFEWFSL